MPRDIGILTLTTTYRLRPIGSNPVKRISDGALQRDSASICTYTYHTLSLFLKNYQKFRCIIRGLSAEKNQENDKDANNTKLGLSALISFFCKKMLPYNPRFVLD